MRNTHRPPTLALRRIAVAAAATITPIVVLAGAADATFDPPPWVLCAYADHPVAADLGPLIPVDVTPPPEAMAVLRGEVAVGTDCAVYDLPV